MTFGIDTAMLAAMREAIGQLLPDTCSILTVTETPDGQGGVSQTWATAYSNVPCRLDIKTRQEPLIGDSLQTFRGYMLSMPYDTVIAFGDRVTIDGTTYAVMSVNDGQSWQAVKRVTVEAV
jgi:hypothetical protein